ncbi:MFS general substrate transporter [Rhizodiscina lignyota]|uniref:MFS general substrate transporter n=1 Tax=Rhizodiscina lignyota TaxID=1504668 RepID=A0A9P4M4A2_9PEZI|nr:MFS general substrate transporter [Rhizodiscina lignyota]
MADEEQSPSAPAKVLSRILEELGLISVYKSAFDTKLLIFQRFIRLFAYGMSTLILVSYLSALGISDTHIGLFMTLTLAGDVIISFLLTLITDGVGRRWMLALGAVLMTGSGVIFGLVGNYWVLLVAAIFGIITPSGNEIGPFRAIEESTLAHLCSSAVRADIFAWYSLVGSAGTACGMMTCGWVVNTLKSKEYWSDVQAYRLIFLAYGAIGVIKLALALSLSKKCEADPEPKPVQDSEEAPLLGNGNESSEPRPKPKKPRKPLFPHISEESRSIFIKLALLFALDSFASGLAPLSWTTNFFRRKFNLAEGYLGSLFFTTSIIAALSVLVAASLARRIGNVKTMVFTHLPSAIALALLGIPNSLPAAMVLLVFRACTQSMDVAPRSAFLAAVLLPNERTAVMGAINVIKTATQSIGPLITGVLVSKNLFWVAFLMAGSLKAVYDLSILAVFVNHQTREEREAQEEAREQAAQSQG